LPPAGRSSSVPQLGEHGMATCFSIGVPVTQPVRDAIDLIPPREWVPALDADGQLRDGAQVCEITGLVAPAVLAAFPTGTRLAPRSQRMDDSAGDTATGSSAAGAMTRWEERTPPATGVSCGWWMVANILRLQLGRRGDPRQGRRPHHLDLPIDDQPVEDASTSQPRLDRARVSAPATPHPAAPRPTMQPANASKRSGNRWKARRTCHVHRAARSHWCATLTAS
jgi:hypothetical protein